MEWLGYAVALVLAVWGLSFVAFPVQRKHDD